MLFYKQKKTNEQELHSLDYFIVNLRTTIYMCLCINKYFKVGL